MNFIIEKLKTLALGPSSIEEGVKVVLV